MVPTGLTPRTLLPLFPRVAKPQGGEHMKMQPTQRKAREGLIERGNMRKTRF